MSLVNIKDVPVLLFVNLRSLKINKKFKKNAEKLRETGIYIYKDFLKDTMDLG